MQLYNVNWARLVVWLLPDDWRKMTTARYLLALIEPVRQSYADFLQFRKQQLYEAEINGQVVKLERILNDTFDPVERRIFITDGEYFTPPVFYEEYKNMPVVFNAEGDSDNPVFWSVENIDNRVAFNFYVHIPSAVWFDRLRVRATVNKYKILGRTFEIKEI